MIEIGKSNVEVFSETLQTLAANDKDLFVITSDSRGSGKLVPFGQKYPDQHIEVGIAEQNLVGVASGVASMHKKAYAVSPACFLTARALEQIKNDVCYSDNAVKLIGISAGVSYGSLGTTHHSLHDFAVLRAINNITIVAPADNYETTQAIIASSILNSPIYIRFGKKNMPLDLRRSMLANIPFEIGKATLIKNGTDVVLIATGETVYPALKAAELLNTNHTINARVLSMHTIKPLDINALISIGQEGIPIITIEEHSVHGGLGEAIASYLFQNGFTNKFKIIGLPDEHTVSGSQNEIFDHYSISETGISKIALNLLNT